MDDVGHKSKTMSQNRQSSRAPPSYLRWDDGMKLTLAKKVCIHKAYIITPGTKMETKWRRIIEELGSDEGFQGSKIESKPWESIQVQFHRFKDEVLSKCGVTSEAVNLSSMEEEPSEYVKLILNMAEEVETRKKDCDAKKEKREQLSQVKKCVVLSVSFAT